MTESHKKPTLNSRKAERSGHRRTRKGLAIKDPHRTQHIVAILTVSSMSFIGILTETSLNVSFPVLSRQFGVSLNMVQWLSSGYLLTIAIIMIASSFLNRRFSARTLFRTGAIAFLVGSLICALSTSFAPLLLGRLLSALAPGLCTPLMFNMVTEFMPVEQRGYWMGVVGLVVAFAPSLGPIFGGVVERYWGWRVIFWIVLALTALTLGVGWATVRRYRPVTHPPFDWARFVVISLVMSSFLIGFNQLGSGPSNPVFWGGLALSIFLVLLFAWMSRHSTRLLFDVAVLHNPRFLLALFAYLLLQALNIGISFVLPSYAQIVNGSSSLICGLILLPGAIIPTLFNPWFGHLYDVYGPRLPLFAGSAFFCAGTLLLAIFGPHLAIWMMIVFYLFLQIGHRLSFNNTLTEAISVAAPERHADAIAVLQTAQQYAGSIGTTLLAAIMALSQRQASGPADPSYAALTAQGATHAFLFALVLAAIIPTLYRVLLCKKDWKKPIPTPRAMSETVPRH